MPRPTHPYIKVRGKWNYLYRAVDKHGKTVDFLLHPDRSVAAAQAFFRKALSRCLPQWPRKITLDGLRQSHLALRYLRREDPKWKYVQVRCSQYLNNLIEQDHRAIKRRCALGTSPRVVLPRGNLKRADLALNCSGTSISSAGNATVPLRSHFQARRCALRVLDRVPHTGISLYAGFLISVTS
jgi:hypothetical protein